MSAQLLSHHDKAYQFKKQYEEIESRIADNDDLMMILEQLASFDFGRFLIEHRGVSGFWSHYMTTFHWHDTTRNNRGERVGAVEHFVMNQMPLMRATQQRNDIFLKENQTQVKEGAVLASVPSGMMGELLYLDYSGIDLIKLVGMDLDEQAFVHADELAETQGLAKRVEFNHVDAWKIDDENRFDLISSNGLTIYEPDDERVLELYKVFHHALKPGAKLVTSFVTPPPQLTEHCEWQLDKLDANELLLQKTIFVDILQATFQCFRSSEQTKTLLEQAGFNDLQFIYDEAHLFPTVTAYK